jgi:hypothetical protein
VVSVSRRAVLLSGIGLAAASVARTGTDPASADHTDHEADDLQQVLDQVPVGGVITVTRAWEVDQPIVVRKPIVVRFLGGSLSTARDIDLIRIDSSDVALVGARLRGTGAEHRGLGRGIRAAGTWAHPLRAVHVIGADIRDMSHDGILLEHCEAFSVSDSVIEQSGYAGVLLFSCSDGEVVRNRIAEVLQPTGYVNSYGIQAVRATATGLDEAPRSSRILIADNEVSGVARWEGIDTHGGSSIVIARNRITDCRVGVALVPSKDEDDATRTKYAPIDLHVVGNQIARASNGPGSGIVVRGAGEAVGADVERATGVISGNSIDGYGDGERDGAILAYLTRGLVIAHNDCSASVRRGVSLYHSNEDIVVHANTISTVADAVSTTSVAVDVRSIANSGHVSANRYVPSDTPAGRVYGLQCRPMPNSLLSVANDWSMTTSAVVAGAGVLRFRDG